MEPEEKMPSGSLTPHPQIAFEEIVETDMGLAATVVFDV